LLSLSRYTHNLNHEHWTEIVQLIKYLRGIMDYDIIYIGFLIVLEGYNDTNLISDSDEIKSTSCYIFILCGRAVSWKSSKKNLIIWSTTESKFIASESVGNEADWLRKFLTEIPLEIKPTPSISMHCDCQATISIAKNKSFNNKNQHFQLKHDVVKQLLKDGITSIDYVKSEMNLVDPLTKPLCRKMILETSRGKWTNA